MQDETEQLEDTALVEEKGIPGGTVLLEDTALLEEKGMLEDSDIRSLDWSELVCKHRSQPGAWRAMKA
jgi:hypothetical protein